MSHAAISAMAVFLLLEAACTNRSSGRGLLPPRPQGAVQESTYRPEKPFETRADGSLSRTVHHAEEMPFTVEVRDLIVPPTGKVTLAEDGAVLAVVQDGSAQLIQRGEASDIGPGKAVALSEGERAQIDNRGPSPLVIRLYLVTVQ